MYVAYVLWDFSPVIRMGPTAPSPAGECVTSLFGSGGGGGTHSLAGEGGPNSDEETVIVVL
jgi:hypothetical protein